MRTRKLLAATAGGLIILGATAACGTAPATDATAPRQSALPSAAAGGESFNEQDVSFLQMMAVHHSGAMSMAAVVLNKEEIDPRVTALAKEIMDAQGPEIATMNAWLEEWGMQDAPMSDMSGMDHSTMDLTPLEEATGVEASRMFLEDMIVHHQDAVDMSETQITAGADRDTIALAEQIIADQQAEIELMEQMLATL